VAQKAPTKYIPVCAFVTVMETANSIEQSPPLEANGHSASQEVPCILSNLKVHYYVHKSLPLVPIPEPD
jgi:hypothetical protein